MPLQRTRGLVALGSRRGPASVSVVEFLPGRRSPLNAGSLGSQANEGVGVWLGCRTGRKKVVPLR